MLRTGKRILSVALVLGGLCGTAWAQSPAQQQGQGGSTLPGAGSGGGATSPSRIIYGDGGSCGCGSGGCGSGGCCNSGCFNNDCCDDCGGLCCKTCGGFVAGAELHVLRPVISNNTGLIFTTTTENDIDLKTNRLENFSFDYTEAPSIWVGYVSDCGLGGRITWFHFYERSKALDFSLTSAESDTLSVTTPSGFFPTYPISNVVDFTTTNTLFIDSYDFDVTQSFRICKLDVTVGAGLRYLHLAQNYIATRTHIHDVGEEEPNSTFTENDSNNFNGWGPTVMCEACRSIGCGGFGLYADSRAGLLFGVRHESSFQQHIDTSGFETDTNTFSDSDELIGFLEIELGVQWSGCYGGTHPFVRLGIEGRGYFDPGSAQSGALFNSSFRLGEGSTTLQFPGAPSLGKDSDIGLYGLTLAAGVTF